MGGCYNSPSSFLLKSFYNKMLGKYTHPSLWGTVPILHMRKLRHRSGTEWPEVLYQVSGDILLETHAHPAEVFLP